MSRWGGTDSGPYWQLIADFLATHSFKQEHGGYPAFEGDYIGDGSAFQANRKVNVFVRAVLCESPESSHIKSAPSRWFLSGEGAAEFCSFAVETELLIEALENVEHDNPIPAVEALEPEITRVLGGLPLYLRLKPCRIEPAPGRTREPRLPAHGIYLEVGEIENEREKPPAYSFAMAGITPFLAFTVALDEYPGPSSFALELDELRQEIEESREG